MKMTMDDLHAMSALLRRSYPVRRVILYGSLARGEATEGSDVDLLVEANTTERFYDRMATVRRRAPIANRRSPCQRRLKTDPLSTLEF